MVRLSEEQYAALNNGEPPPPPKARRRTTPQSWRCMTLVEKALPYAEPGLYPCGEVITSEAAMRRHLPVHGVGARFECIP
jgi:hypothetical protein